MKVVDLSQLYKYSFYITDISPQKIMPNLEVKDYLYKDTPTSHFTYGYKGKACYFDKNINLEITPGTLAYIPKGTTIHFKENEEYEYYKIYFHLFDAKSGEEIIFSEKPIIYLNNTPEELSTLISEFAMFFAINNSSAQLKFNSYFFSFLYTLNNILKSDNSTSIVSMISSALLYMQNHFSHDFTTKDLADMCNLSEPYFRALFKKQMNITPTEYKNYLRIRRACEIMLVSSMSISSVSEMVGYNNVQYFCNIFKRIVGTTPTQYRKGNKRAKDGEPIEVKLSQLKIYTPVNK